MKTVAVLQSNYIPWKGYFDIIHEVDEFIFYDEVQYTSRDWRNRNKIQTAMGTAWLTVPTGNNVKRTIDEVILADCEWQKKHYDTLMHNYSKAPYIGLYKDFMRETYLDTHWESLSLLNQYLIQEISVRFLEINTVFTNSRDYQSSGVKHDKLLSIVKASGADRYISGPAAKNYMIEEDYRNEKIDVVWKDYSGYPEYEQLYSPFTHFVTIFDLLFNKGYNSPYYIWGWR